MRKNEVIILKNASFYIISCILLSLFIPFAVFWMRNEPPVDKDYIIKVEDVQLNRVYEMSLEDYVLCVLRQEVPASFEKEALKSQAVAIRSYALRKIKSGTHENADVCTSYAHCMAYLSEQNAKEKWGEKFNRFNDKYKQAVNETKNQVLEYDGEVANTVFFAISSGRTENAADVWGGNVPYLISVDSSEDINADGFKSVVEVSQNEFKKTLDIDEIKTGEISRGEGGTVKNIFISGKNFKGSEIRKLFSLRSSNFEINVSDSVKFTVKGYGHGVGMSQNGANECAKKGMKYDEILFKYYTGTKLVDLF